MAKKLRRQEAGIRFAAMHRAFLPKNIYETGSICVTTAEYFSHENISMVLVIKDEVWGNFVK